MRTLLLTGAALALLAASMTAHAADIYAPAPGYGAVPPPAPRYSAVPAPGYGAVAPPVYQDFAEAPPPPYAPLDPPVAYPVPPRYSYGPEGYGPQPGYVYSGPPVASYQECWWEWGRRVCAWR
jgi:hypothetical protein